MRYNFDIESIDLAILVTPSITDPTHKNRPNHGIIFRKAGATDYCFEKNNLLHTRENDIVYIPKGANYTVSSYARSCCYAINFQLFNNISFNPFNFKTKNFAKFLKLFQDCELTWRTKHSGYEMKCMSLLYSILYNLRTEYEIGYISSNSIKLIKPAIDFIHAEYTNENISISHLSSICDMCETYFRRIFFKCFGTSPIKYINNLKIERAKELLTSGIYSIREVAIASGFHDDAYFSRKFKETVGKSPSEYIFTE